MKKRDLNQEEDDQLQSFEAKTTTEDSNLVGFIQKKGKIITIVSVLVIVVIAAGLYMRNQSIKKSERAAVLLTRVMEYYENGDFEKALSGDPDKTYLGEPVKGLKFIADDYGDTDQGKIAALYSANALVSLGKSSEASSYFDKAGKSSSDIIKIGGLAGKASVLELSGKYKEAANLYIESAKLSIVENVQARYLFYAGLCFEKANDKDLAEQNYREVIKINEFGEFGTAAKSGLTRIGTIIE